MEMDAEKQWVKQWWGQIDRRARKQESEGKEGNQYPPHIWSPSTFQPWLCLCSKRRSRVFGILCTVFV